MKSTNFGKHYHPRSIHTFNNFISFLGFEEKIFEFLANEIISPASHVECC
jgi:hypothetical protein